MHRKISRRVEYKLKKEAQRRNRQRIYYAITIYSLDLINKLYTQLSTSTCSIGSRYSLVD